ncbi:hypothetical protein CcaCcLH18_05640 [Colletotrichum camelliae]|nr:hypothetical protein CcaCcLH18_05640 [Colletotrichum camelliae]
MLWSRFLVLPIRSDKGPSSHDTDAIVTPNLNTLPGEILVKIAEYLHLDSPEIFPASEPERTYTSTDGTICQYYPWAPHFPGSYRHPNERGRGYYRRHADRDTLAHLHKGGRPRPCRDVINFSLTSRRIFSAFQVYSYRAPVAVGHSNVRKLLSNITKSNRLQDSVREMAVVYDMVEQASCKPRNWFPLFRLKKRINSDTLEFRSLRSLDIALEPWVKEPKHVAVWCKLLPKLPALERISFKHFRGLELHLPHLPRITEAHFYNCAAWCHWRARTMRQQPRRVLSRLPALRSLGVYNSFSTHDGALYWAPDTFDRIMARLEFLAWSHKHSSSCLDGYIEAEIPVSSLKKVKRLSLCWYHFVNFALRTRDSEEQDDFMPSLETFELHTAFEIRAWWEPGLVLGVSSTELLIVLGWLEARCQVESSKIRIVDLRAVGLVWKAEPPFTTIGVILTDYQKRLRDLGVELLFYVCG